MAVRPKLKRRPTPERQKTQYLIVTAWAESNLYQRLVWFTKPANTLRALVLGLGRTPDSLMFVAGGQACTGHLDHE